MRTVVIRVLLDDDADEDRLVENLVAQYILPDRIRGAVLVELGYHKTIGCPDITVIEGAHVVTTLGHEEWDGDSINYDYLR